MSTADWMTQSRLLSPTVERSLRPSIRSDLSDFARSSSTAKEIGLHCIRISFRIFAFVDGNRLHGQNTLRGFDAFVGHQRSFLLRGGATEQDKTSGAAAR